MYQFINELLDPYRILVLFLIAAGVFFCWKERSNRRLKVLLAAILFLSVISTPAVSYLALGSLEWQFRPITDRPDESQAMVVLAGWWMPSDAYRPKAELGHDSIYRCLHAAELYRRSPCLVVLSGSQTEPRADQPSIARLMKELMMELGVPDSDLMVEERARSTYESADECRRLFNERGIERITLVTEANHMLRAVRSFEKAGLFVTPAPCDFKASQFEWRPSSFLPSPSAARGIQEALHEWLGLAWYWWQDRI